MAAAGLRQVFLRNHTLSQWRENQEVQLRAQPLKSLLENTFTIFFTEQGEVPRPLNEFIQSLELRNTTWCFLILSTQKESFLFSTHANRENVICQKIMDDGETVIVNTFILEAPEEPATIQDISSLLNPRLTLLEKVSKILDLITSKSIPEYLQRNLMQAAYTTK